MKFADADRSIAGVSWRAPEGGTYEQSQEVGHTKARHIRLAELRINRGWTQEQVAQAIADLAAIHGKTTGITANYVSRLERGSCSWPHTLVPEFEELFDCPAADLGFVNRRVGGPQYSGHGSGYDSCQGLQGSAGTATLAPTQGDDNEVENSSHEILSPDIYSPLLAAYGTPQLYIVSNNDEYRRTFPGITVGSNLLEWIVLNPLARDVMVEWDLETRLLGNSMRQSARDPRNNEARTIIRKCLEESPEFASIWNDADVSTQRPRPYQLLRNLDSGEIRRVNCSIWIANTNAEAAHLYIGKPLLDEAALIPAA